MGLSVVNTQNKTFTMGDTEEDWGKSKAKLRRAAFDSFPALPLTLILLL
jgi:hypothetical protein